MKKLIDLVNKSFMSSDKLNNKMVEVNELRMHFVSSLSDAQCIKFLKLLTEVEELQKIELIEYIKHTYKVCKDVFSLR